MTPITSHGNPAMADVWSSNVMDIIVGSGNNRHKFTIKSGKSMRDFAKNQPREYAQQRGHIVNIIRNGVKK